MRSAGAFLLPTVEVEQIVGSVPSVVPPSFVASLLSSSPASVSASVSGAKARFGTISDCDLPTGPADSLSHVKHYLEASAYVGFSFSTDHIRDPDEAFYCCNLSVVVEQIVEWNRIMPRVHALYAMKACPNNRLIQILRHFGAGFDCASKKEITKVTDLLGLSPQEIADDVIFAHPIKKKVDIAFADKVGVRKFVVDCPSEVRKMASVSPKAGLVIRLKTVDSHSVCQFSTKFGASLKEAKGLLELAHSLHCKVLGVSFHVGSGCLAAGAYRAALRDAKSLFDLAERTYGYKMTLLDLGGGFPGERAVVSPLFKAMGKEINECLKEFFPLPDFAHVRVVAEPGRYFSAPAFILAMPVIGKKEKSGDEGEPSFHYYFPDGVYGSFNCVVFDHINPVFRFVRPKSDATQYRSTVWGPTCDSMDAIVKDVRLPELDIGEWVFLENFGAYTSCAACPFNGFEVEALYYYWTPAA